MQVWKIEFVTGNETQNQTEVGLGRGREEAASQCSHRVPASQQTCTFDRSLEKLNAICLSTKGLFRLDGAPAAAGPLPSLAPGCP